MQRNVWQRGMCGWGAPPLPQVTQADAELTLFPGGPGVLGRPATTLRLPGPGLRLPPFLEEAGEHPPAARPGLPGGDRATA